jgi:Uncharacterized protein conserved in bacteria (DUF2199)
VAISDHMANFEAIDSRGRVYTRSSHTLTYTHCVVIHIRGHLAHDGLNVREPYSRAEWAGQVRVTLKASISWRRVRFLTNPTRAWTLVRLVVKSTEGLSDTLNLKCQIHPRGGRQRPAIEIKPTDRPLAAEQREGIKSTGCSKSMPLMVTIYADPML